MFRGGETLSIVSALGKLSSEREKKAKKLVSDKKPLKYRHSVDGK